MKSVMNKIYLIKTDAVADIKTAIKDSGDSIVGIIGVVAAAVSLIITSIAGLALLVICLATAFKSWRGNSDAWTDAMQTIAVVAAVLCFSTAVSTIFF